MTTEIVPQQRCLRPQQVADKLAIGLSTLWSWVKHDPDFPQPARKGARWTVWLDHDIDRYVAKKRAAGSPQDAIPATKPAPPRFATPSKPRHAVARSE
ncbi:MAG: AlpA family phage regulatory protein [Pseudomonadota bacterium]